MERDIKNKVVVVTGGANGIGLSIAKKFALEGARRVVIVDIDEEKGRAAVEEITRSGGVAEFIQGDLSGGGERAFETLTGEHTVDVLVNNAGVGDETDPKRLIAINLTAPVELSLKFSNIMNKQNGGGGGTIINICSRLGFVVLPTNHVYIASKFGLTAFSRALGYTKHYEKTGVRVIALCPAHTRTKIIDDFEHHKKLKDVEWQSPDAVGDAAVDVFKNADSGTAWFVQGGRPARKLDLDYKKTSLTHQ